MFTTFMLSTIYCSNDTTKQTFNFLWIKHKSCYSQKYQQNKLTSWHQHKKNQQNWNLYTRTSSIIWSHSRRWDIICNSKHFCWMTKTSFHFSGLGQFTNTITVFQHMNAKFWKKEMENTKWRRESWAVPKYQLHVTQCKDYLSNMSEGKWKRKI